jgi:hypothetical protein
LNELSNSSFGVTIALGMRIEKPNGRLGIHFLFNQVSMIITPKAGELVLNQITSL